MSNNRKNALAKNSAAFDRKKLFVIALAFVALVAGIDMFTNDTATQDIVVVDGKVMNADDVQTMPQSNNAAQVTSGAPITSPLPGRMVGVPNYDRTMMAGRIINESVNIEAAQAFIGLQTTRRNVRIQSEIAELTAKIKVAEATTAEAEVRIRDAKQGGGKVRTLDVVNNQIPTDLQPVNGTDIGVTPIPTERIWRLTGFDNISGDMTFQFGDRWFRGVKSGQTIEGNLVGDIDRKLRCVPLTKDAKTSVVCLN